ncbi:hypothetical protein F4777DRAFT_63859 [Nemania sp. FL0916]|nr:hypothetical protein F4777DRAFT_63859 [Nemania sp. FL0916]
MFYVTLLIYVYHSPMGDPTEGAHGHWRSVLTSYVLDPSLRFVEVREILICAVFVIIVLMYWLYCYPTSEISAAWCSPRRLSFYLLSSCALSYPLASSWHNRGTIKHILGILIFCTIYDIMFTGWRHTTLLCIRQIRCC